MPMPLALPARELGRVGVGVDAVEPDGSRAARGRARRARLAADAVRCRSGSATTSPHREARVERLVGILEDHPERRAHRPERPALSGRTACRWKRSAPSFGRSRPDDQPGGRRLAASRLAHDADASGRRRASSDTPSTAVTLPVPLRHAVELDDRRRSPGASEQVARGDVCPGPTSVVSGTASAHGSWTCAQRGWNGQPGGITPAGGAPAMVANGAFGGGLGSAADRLEQRARVGVRRAREHLVRRPLLDDPAAVHDGHAVGDLGDDAHVVGDPQERDAVLGLQRRAPAPGSRPAPSRRAPSSARRRSGAAGAAPAPSRS